MEFAGEWVASCGISSLVNCTGNDILCMNIHTHAVYTQPLQDGIFAIATNTLGVSIGGCCNCLVVWLFVRCWVFLFFTPPCLGLLWTLGWSIFAFRLPDALCCIKAYVRRGEWDGVGAAIVSVSRTE